MNPKTGQIVRARKMAREQAARYIRPGDPGYWAKVDEIFDRLMREQLAFEDWKTRKNPTRLFPDPRYPRQNPPEDIDPTPYERFHGVPPNRVEEARGWVPGEMVLLGQAVDEGYVAKDRRSNKGAGQPYVHDNGSGVRVWRRAKSGETPDKTWRNFPTELTLMGTALGFTYRDHNGKLHEVKGGSKKMYTPPSRRMLVIVDGTGVKYVIEGGNLYVDDWIRN